MAQAGSRGILGVVSAIAQREAGSRGECMRRGRSRLRDPRDPRGTSRTLQDPRWRVWSQSHLVSHAAGKEDGSITGESLVDGIANFITEAKNKDLIAEMQELFTREAGCATAAYLECFNMCGEAFC